ncbi:MAG: Solitary outer membrane autotransporter beta-barrel domain [Bdellovibrionota bacterium]
MKIKLFTLLFSFLIFASSASAQSIFTLEEQIELVNGFNTALRQDTSALVGFSSISSVSGGNFTFEGQDGQSDTELDVYRIPLRYNAGEVGDEFRPFVELIVGHVKTDRLNQAFDPSDPKLDRIKTETTSFGVNLGTAWEFMDGFTLEPGVEASYSHFKRTTDYNSDITQLIVILEPFLDRNFFNTSVDIFSVIPSIRQKIEGDVLGLKSGLDVKYNYIRNTSLHSKSEVISYRSSASILQSKLHTTIPTGINIISDDLDLKPFISRTDLFADARKGMGMSYYHEIGLAADFEIPQLPEYFSQLEIGAGYTFGDDFHGFRVGVSFL